jgi:hypothetical protein
MKLSQLSTVISAIAIATMFEMIGVVKPATATSMQLIGLDNNNNLVSFDPNNLTSTRRVGVSGITGNLVGIDFRPRNGDLFGVTDANQVYTINPDTGVATLVLTPNATPFTLNGTSFGFDFNPTPDAIRVVSDANQSTRLSPNTGGLAGTDTPLAYAATDLNAGKDPNIVAAAYTNSFAPSPDPTRRTTLYVIDSVLDTLATQGSMNFLPGSPSPAVSPNTGRLFTVGSLGIDFGSFGGFDILSSNGVDTAFAASGSSLYSINLSTGAATTLGTIDGGNVNIVGLAARSVPEPGTIGALIGFGALGLLGSCRRRVKSLS